MSDAPGTRPTPSVVGRGRRFTDRATRPVRPIWETAFRDPVRDSHLRLTGLTSIERQLARLGLVTLTLLLISVLLSSIWRRGTLLPLDGTGQLTFLPVGLLPVTLMTFLIAWTLLSWGALAAAPAVRLIVAAVFLLTNATLSVATSIEVGDRAALTYGPDMINAGYFLMPAVLVLSALLNRLTRTSGILRPVFRGLTLIGLALFFLTHLWIHVVFVGLGFQGSVQQLMSGTITEIDGLLLPLVFVSGVLVIDFSLDVAEGVALSTREAPLRVARWLLVALLAVKLWVELIHRWGDWTTYVQDRPTAVARTVVSIVALALVVRLVTKGPPTVAFENAKERLLYGSGVALALSVIVTILVVGFGLIQLTQFEADRIPGFVSGYPSEAIADYSKPAMAAVAVFAGVWLLRRRRGPMDVELGSGLIVLGAWALPTFLLNLTDIELGFSDPLVDVLITLGVAVYLALRWRTLDLPMAITLTALTVFAWLVMTRGDWISVFGSLLGLPAILVIVVGVAFSLAGDSGFTAESSNRLPQGARVLLFVGYLILSVTILNWVEATHADSFAAQQADSGFFFLGIPWAAWLVGRRLLHLDEQLEESHEVSDQAVVQSSPP